MPGRLYSARTGHESISVTYEEFLPSPSLRAFVHRLWVLDGEPAGWCNVEPRTAYPYLRSVPWRKRKEDRSDASIWAVPCFITRSGFRRRGLSYALARAAVDFARERGARALEGYSMIPERGKDVQWGELSVGHVSIFTAAGFAEVSRPTLRRAVMRIDF